MLVGGVRLKKRTNTSTSKEQRAVVAGLEPAAVVKAGLQDGVESHGARTKVGSHGKTYPPADGQGKKEVPQVPDRKNRKTKAMQTCLPWT